MHAYEVRPRKDNGVDLISDVLPFGGLWYYGPDAVAKALCASGRIVGPTSPSMIPKEIPSYVMRVRWFGALRTESAGARGVLPNE